MIKIGVISDTHIPKRSKSLPAKIFDIFKDVDMILHAGDILTEEVLIDLSLIAPIHVVAGNNDSYELYERYGIKEIIEVGGKKIGLTHGDGRGNAKANAYDVFKNDHVDCIVYGHSHASYNVMMNDILFFNPGSPTDKRWNPDYTIGLLYVSENITGEIISL